MPHQEELEQQKVPIPLVDDMARTIDELIARLLALSDNTLVTRHAVERARLLLIRAHPYRIRR